MSTRGAADIILAASIRCFEQLGMHRATMEDIAKAAGVSRKTVYRHFANKNQLIAAFAERESRQACDTARATLDLSLAPDLLVATAEYALLNVASTRTSLGMFIDEDQVLQTLDVLVHADARNAILSDYWQPVFDRLAATDALRTDVPRARMLHWIIFVHSTLMARPGLIADDHDGGVSVELLRDFLSPSIVARHIR